MRSPSIDTLYLILKKHLRLVESYLDSPNLAFVFRACRLKPKGYVLWKNNIILYKWWLDEYGNSVKILKNKRLKIIYGDLSIDRDKIACTDLYYGLSLDKIRKMSKFAYISHGLDEDTYQDCVLISFLGIDNYFRTYLYLYGSWQQVSTLVLGIRNLSIIAKNLDLKYYKELSNENIKLPCAHAKTWLTCLPISREFSDTLDKQCGIVSSIFKQN